MSAVVEQQRLAGDEVGGGDVFGGLAGVVDVLGTGEAFAGGAGGRVGGRAELDLRELHVGHVDQNDARQEHDDHQADQNRNRPPSAVVRRDGGCFTLGLFHRE